MLREKYSVYHAAQAAGVGRTTIYSWRAQDAEFAQAWDEAKEDAIDVLETSAYERALAGDTTLTIFLLKHNRDQYRERREVPEDIQRRPVILQCLHYPQEGANGQSNPAASVPASELPETPVEIPREWR